MTETQKLTKKEETAQRNYRTKLKIKPRKTTKPVIVALIGLVGSGKNSVARELAKQIGGTVIEADAIRIELRKQNERYDHTRDIIENLTAEVITQGGNVVIDSDFVDQKKRASIRKKAKKEGARLLFIRTYCDLDVAVGRVLTATYNKKVDDFFGGASSKWHGSGQSKGAAVKVREMWRRTPHHYHWVNQEGGRWVLRKFPFALFAEIDTTKEKWRQEIKRLTLKI
jgi:predicted kinase